MPPLIRNFVVKFIFSRFGTSTVWSRTPISVIVRLRGNMRNVSWSHVSHSGVRQKEVMF